MGTCVLLFVGTTWLSKDEEHIKALKAIFEMPVHILQGLPHGTEATQWLDQGFTEYKPACDVSTMNVDTRKIAAHVADRKK